MSKPTNQQIDITMLMIKREIEWLEEQTKDPNLRHSLSPVKLARYERALEAYTAVWQHLLLQRDESEADD